MWSPSQVALPFSPFYAITRDGLDRLMDFVNQDPFTFVVNGEKHESTVAEAISLSPIVHESLRLNPLQNAFHFPGSSIKSSDFGAFLDFVRCRGCVEISCDRVLSFVSISGALGNERLGFSLLSSMGRVSGVDGRPTSRAAASASVLSIDASAVDRWGFQFLFDR
jgi:hypothetical protein